MCAEKHLLPTPHLLVSAGQVENYRKLCSNIKARSRTHPDQKGRELINRRAVSDLCIVGAHATNA